MQEPMLNKISTEIIEFLWRTAFTLIYYVLFVWLQRSISQPFSSALVIVCNFMCSFGNLETHLQNSQILKPLQKYTVYKLYNMQ